MNCLLSMYDKVKNLTKTKTQPKSIICKKKYCLPFQIERSGQFCCERHGISSHIIWNVREYVRNLHYFAASYPKLLQERSVRICRPEN